MKKINKNNLIIRILVTIFILFSLYFLILFVSRNGNEIQYKSQNQIIRKDKPVIYTSNYSGRFITENVKVSDDRFKDKTFFERKNLLSSAINSIFNRGEVINESGLEKGTWLWTPIKYITPKYRDSIISGSKKNGVDVIYLSLDSYLDIFVMPEGKEKQKAKKDFDDTVRSFISKANESGIKVDAEAGWQNWAEEGHLYKPGAILDYVISFNKENKENFRGFQYDVEVYLLPEYKDNKQKVLTNFLDLIDKTITKLSSTGLQFSVVIPDFYDDSTLETPIFKYKGKMGYTLEHLFNILDKRSASKIIVMSYRNFAKGENGSIEISKDEINIGNNHRTKVVIAQETGDFDPSFITFYKKSRSYFDSQIAILNNTFEGESSFGGTAVHYINTFLELK